MIPGHHTVAVAVALAAALVVPASGCRHREGPGAVVERVEPGGAASEAGILPGDRLTAWSGPSGHGTLRDPLDLTAVEEEQAPRGPVTITLVRNGRTRPVVLPRGLWGLNCRPAMPPRSLARYRHLLSGPANPATAATALERLAATSVEDARLAAWLLARAGERWVCARAFDDARRCFAMAEERLGNPSGVAVLLELEGSALIGAGHPRDAVKPLTRALALRRRILPDSPTVAWTVHQLSRTNLRGFGTELEEAEAIYASLGHPTVERAVVLADLAIRHHVGDDLEAAEGLYRQALAILVELAPRSKRRAMVLGNLGLLLQKRGDYAEAARLVEESLHIHERIDPASREVVYALNALGLVAKRTGRFGRAAVWYERALEVARRIGPDGVEVAGLLNNLGNAAMRQGDLDGAWRWHRQAARLRHRLHKGGAEEASSLHNLGLVASRRGEDGTALRFFERALAIKRRVCPGTLSVANTLLEIATVRSRQGDPEGARLAAEEALRLRRTIVPGSLDEAEALLALGDIDLAAGEDTAAETRWSEALTVADRHRSRLTAGAEDHARLAGALGGSARRLARLLASEGRNVEAFRLLDGSRAATLRAILASRPVIHRALPGPTAAKLVRLEIAIDRIRGRLARSGTGAEAGTLREIQDRLTELETEHRRLLGTASRSDPGLAALLDPGVLNEDLLAEALSGGTLLLEYCVTASGTTLFATRKGDGGGLLLETREIPEGETALARRVELVRGFLRSPAATLPIEQALRIQLGALHDLLIGPASEAIGAAERVVIVPDGPLEALPFGALLDLQRNRFLGAWRPITVAPSGAVFAGLVRKRGAAGRFGNVLVVAVPDPGSGARGSSPPPIPSTHVEAERIAARWPGALLLEGPRATVAAFLRHAPEAGLIHMAVHGELDRSEPWESALLLAPGDGSATGRLTAGDVAIRLRAHARVVVLSSCSTAGGAVPGDPGITGLARAFQLAGAHTVVAALWPVPDRSTTALMTRLHTGLASGLPTADALRQARHELLHTAGAGRHDLRHPAHWAAFRVIGDWW